MPSDAEGEVVRLVDGAGQGPEGASLVDAGLGDGQRLDPLLTRLEVGLEGSEGISPVELPGDEVVLEDGGKSAGHAALDYLLAVKGVERLIPVGVD